MAGKIAQKFIKLIFTPSDEIMLYKNAAVSGNPGYDILKMSIPFGYQLRLSIQSISDHAQNANPLFNIRFVNRY